jgi:hypothetical protein
VKLFLVSHWIHSDHLGVIISKLGYHGRGKRRLADGLVLQCTGEHRGGGTELTILLHVGIGVSVWGIHWLRGSSSR